ncbi:ABC transporter substrate-binding protein [Bacillus sp. CGMCC 1.16607]|uniref:peptide-binding protein n=1 Tax=Bacillus sp. CGMCC 1.16607 TaxID=3351842 RepID=UPI00363D66A2
MLKKKSWLVMLCFVLLLGVLAACSGGKEKASNSSDGKSSEPKKGGTIIGAMDTAPAGLFNPVFYSDSYENNILAFTHEGLLSQDKNLGFIPNLAKEWTFNDDQTEVTFKLEEGAKWHDGKPFTANDVVFTYKTIASPGYIEAGGVRTSFAERLLGYKEFSEGKTKDFQGVVAVDEHTVTFKYAEPNVLALADAAFSYLMPEHIFKDIPIKDMPSAGPSRNPGEVIGTGPFKLAKMVEGEQYILEKNADYWKGEPFLDSVVWKIVDQAVILGLLENGEIDFVSDPNGFQAADYETVAALDHVKIIEQPDFGYQIMGMMVNHRAKDDQSLDPTKWTVNKKLADKKVRQAIAYAVDRQGIINGLLYGRGIVQNSPMATQFWAYDAESPNQYKFDPEQAKKLLDEAGYVDKDGDGFREDPEGAKWVLHLNYPTGNQIRERSAPIIEEFLEKVGINIDLRQPKEAAAFYEDLELNAQDWDLYLAGWSLDSTDPDPSGLWSSKASYNYSRWNNPEADKLLVEAASPPNAFEQDFRKQKYSEWQVMYGDDLPALILYAASSLWAHNKRLQGIEVLPYTFVNNPHLWNVTE